MDAGNARRVGRREVERQQKELRQAVMQAAEITVGCGRRDDPAAGEGGRVYVRLLSVS